MKNRILNIAAVVVASASFSVSCSDRYMEKMNTDPSKAATIDPNAQLTTSQLQTYGDLNMVEMYRNYHYAFTQHLMGCWNTTNYGGLHTFDSNEMGRLWTTFYPNAIKNLTDAVNRTKDDGSKTNIHAALTIYRVYMMSLITDVHGDVPCSEAGYGYISQIYNPRYDTQKEIYESFFADLKAASAALDPAKDRITGDVIYGGDIVKWKKLANSLRLRFAMRVSDVLPKVAEQEFTDALAAEGGVFASSADEALVKYMDLAFSFGSEAYTDYRSNALSKLLFGADPANNPSYLCSTLFNKMYENGDPRTFMISRCYYDGLMSQTAPDNRIDLTQEIIDMGVEFQPRDPGAYSWEPWPTGYDSEILRELSQTNPSVGITVARETEPKVANNFLRGDNPGVVMTYAEVEFLKAEAALKKWQVEGSVEDHYKAGVRAAMDFLTERYGCDEVSGEDFEKYIAANGIGRTDELAKEAINTQAWILHFTNPAECWANQRRSGYPRLKSPAEYGFGHLLTGGREIPVRLCYPILESSYNKANYDEALERMGGKDSWNTRVWWDAE